ncbi:MAG: glutathione S-transferase family protein [Amphiplicatus sp.]|uniref:glutathione S-transferase family protein n=1 Tax=Methylocystis sp. TaxID=1911079 RepID=UPI003D103EB9
MKLFWQPQTRAFRMVWMLEEAGVDYERVPIDIRDPAKPRDPEFALASPMGKVPALADGEARFADSAAIALYIADRYPKAGLAPAIDDPKRGLYLWWMIFTPGVIEPAINEKFSGGTPNRFRSGWGDFDLMIESFAKGVTPGPWLLGEKFSAADVMIGSSAIFMKDFGMLPANKAIEAYGERCLQRPAYQRALEIENKGA